MTSKIQQAKNEKILKELARVPENKKCAICTCMGTQYTCQPPSIYVCSSCAGALYHFPGFRVKSRSMATYTTQEVQQMKEGGNGQFIKQYLAKWNSNTFPAPVDKNPKRVEEFIRQVLVEKVFYSDEPVSKDNINKEVLNTKPRAIPSTTGSGNLQKQTSLTQTSNSTPSWGASFPAAKTTEINTSNSGQSTLTGTSGGGGNWADFGATSLIKVQGNSQSLDPFLTTSQDLASPRSAGSMPVQIPPMTTPQPQGTPWDPFQEKPVVQNHPKPTTVPTGWSTFEATSASSLAKDTGLANTGFRAASQESGNFDVQQTVMPVANDGVKPKATTPRSPAMDPLPEEWFSVGNTPVPSAFGSANTALQSTGPQQSSSFMMPSGHQQVQHSSIYGARQNFQNSQTTSAFSYGHPHMSPPVTPVSFTQFRSTPTSQVPGAQSWNATSNPYTLQTQDSMNSYVSARVDNTAHHPLFQNLDMDMRAKAHSVAGVPVQTRGVYRNGQIPGNTNHLARPDATTAQIQQTFMQQQQQQQQQQQRNFGGASGNPFA
eukprot:g939.t1